MLKNQSNAALQTSVFMRQRIAEVCAPKDEIELLYKIGKFIENCPCKIKRIKIEGFV